MPASFFRSLASSQARSSFGRPGGRDPPGRRTTGDVRSRCPGAYVLPGLLDPHVHSGLLPPLADRLQAESAFALSGGITTILRYFRRPDSYIQTLPGQVELGAQRHYQDFTHHLTLFNAAQVAEMGTYVRDFGVTSFKLYMNLKGPFGKGVLMDLRTDQPERSGDRRRRLQRRSLVGGVPCSRSVAGPSATEYPFGRRRDRRAESAADPRDGPRGSAGVECGETGCFRGNRHPDGRLPIAPVQGTGLLPAHRLARGHRGAAGCDAPWAPTMAPRYARSTSR